MEETYLHIMRDTLSDYGHDGQDLFIDQNIGMGCCVNNKPFRFKETKPVLKTAHNHIVMVSDAVIYNRDELIELLGLSGGDDISNNDLISAAYRKWDVECPRYLNGDFTFAVWEKEKKRLLLFRDHMGVRPMFYYFNHGVFAFSTDYRALLALPFVEKQIDNHTMYDLLVNGKMLFPEQTYFRHIRKALPAHVLSISPDMKKYIKYWTPGQGKKIRYDSEKEYQEAMYDVVRQSIRARLNVLDTVVGAELSGGLDSTVIDILANRELNIKGDRIPFVFNWGPSFESFQRQERDERDFIQEVCEKEDFICIYYDQDKTMEKHDVERITPVEENYPGVIRQVMKNAKEKEICILLTGWGGDQGISHRAGLFELLANGYWGHYLKEIFLLSKGSFLRFIKIALSSSILALFRPYNYLSRKDYSANIANLEFNLKNKRFRKKQVVYLGIKPVKHLESGNIQTRTDLTAWIGADYGIQYLYPFLDHHVVDFAMGIPAHLHYKNGINRYLFRKTFEKILPADLCYYKYKDDIARVTHFKSMRSEWNTERELLDGELDRTLFSEYLDFERASGWLNGNGRKDDDGKLRLLRKQLSASYNLQKLLGYFQNS